MSRAVPRTADVVVVGGGIVGTAIAYRLAVDGFDTVLLERRAFGGAVTGGSLACIGTHMHSVEELPVLVEARDLWSELSERLGNPFELNRCGQLRFIKREEDAIVAKRWIDAERAHGLRPELLTPADVRELEPRLTGPIVGASWSPDDVTVNPFLAVRSLIKAGRHHGLSEVHDIGAVRLLSAGQRVTGVETTLGRISAGETVIAAGPWTAQIAASLNMNVELPIRPRQAQCLATVRQPQTIRRVVGACESSGGVDAGYTQIQQSPSGQVLFNTVSATARAAPDTMEQVHEVPIRFVRQSIEMLRWLFPVLAQIELLRSWVRFEAVTPDERFLAGRVLDPGLLVAAGDNGTGFCRALLLGRLISQTIRGVDGGLAATMYRPDRFDEA